MTNPHRRTTVATKAMGDGLGVFDSMQNRSYVLNATSALVFQHCDGQTTPQQLAELLRQKFNLSRGQAEQLLELSLGELHTANLLQTHIARPANPQRRQLLKGLAVAGLSLVVIPMVAPVEVQAATGSVFPTLQCVSDNGDGTYTAFFGYVNTSSSTIVIPYDPSHSKNMFTATPKFRGQPDTFYPGTQEFVFSVVFDGSKITWIIKENQAARQQIDADANSGCEPPTTT